MGEKQFEVGDVVRLKSGGPAMTVGALREDEQGTSVGCVWAGAAEAHEHWFPAPCLETASPAAARMAHPVRVPGEPVDFGPTKKLG